MNFRKACFIILLCAPVFCFIPKASASPVERPDSLSVISSLEESVESSPADTLKPVFAFRSNLLLPLMNVGVQIPVGNRVSIGLDWYYPFPYRNWAPFLRQQNCFQMLSAGMDVRYYFGDEHSRGSGNWLNRLSGHSIGLYGYVGKYDIEVDWVGQQGRFVNAGVDYTWSAFIGKKRMLRLDLTVGVGAIVARETPYRVFRVDGDAYKTGAPQDFLWVGPTKAAVSLVIPIYQKVRRTENEK